MLLSAQEMHAAANATKPAWAIFDAVWYLKTYAQARDVCKGDHETALKFYLEVGASFGQSPSPLFDEIYYLEQNPDISELITQEKYRSGFDHFCQIGHRSLSPHWLFDDQLYGRLYEDMTLENLDLHGCAGRYDHYLKSGQFERRQAHFLFDGAFYQSRAIAAGIAEEELNAAGPYAHYLYSLTAGNKELAPSIYFDPAWYLSAGFGVKSAIENRKFASAIEHYLRNETPALFDPVAEFSESYYCESNRDISQAVDNGLFRCGYQHFVQFGAFELRRPHPNIDLVYYRDMNPRVGDDLNKGAFRDAFSHLRMIGIREKLIFSPVDSFVEINEQSAKQLFFTKAQNNLLLFTRQKLDFRATNPKVSIIMVAFNRFELTMLALTSVRMNFPGELEIILVDNGSSDPTKWIDRYIDGAIILHMRENIGFSRAANIALGHASAPATLYLNNDIELGFQAIDTAIKRLESATDIGAVGGKIVRSHGKLQEAGSIIWNDGTTTGYMRDALSSTPEANFLREVDYCSGVFLLTRTDLLKSLNGLDEDYSPAYYEDADLCVRLAKAGYKIIYDPAVVVHHLEFGSSENSDASMVLMKRGHRIFNHKHHDFISQKFTELPSNIIKARSVSPRKKILFIEDTVPLRYLGSGFVRANDVVKAIVASGYDVTIFPINGTSQNLISLLADFPGQVEILYDQDFLKLPQFLSERSSYYDVVWVSRTHNLNRILPLCIAAGINPNSTPFVLDTEAIVSCRDAARALVLPHDTSFNLQEHLINEFAHAHSCAEILAVSKNELAILRDLGLPKISLLGTISQRRPTASEFSAREGLLFVASIHQNDSPNLDSLYWFRDEIFDWLCQEMERPPVLNFVGYVADNVDLSDLADDPRIRIHGPTDDLTQHYESNRVFIAPTRFAAGTPYKIYEAASFGLPCVTTDLLARQLGWSAGLDLLAAPVNDARRFASQIAMLYRTESLWTKLRQQALIRLAAENDPNRFNATVRDILANLLNRPKPAPHSTAAGNRLAPGKSMPV